MSFFSRKPPETKALRCSFCNKEQKDVDKLIAGPQVFICDECIKVCNDIVADDSRFVAPTSITADTTAGESPSSPHPQPTTRVVTCALCQMPLPWEDALAVPERGALCPGCTSAIEAAIAERR